MRRPPLFAAVLTFLLLIASAIPAAAALQPVRIAAFNFYPTIFQAQDGSVRGFYVDFLNEIAQREGWQITYVYGNWAEGLERVRRGEVDVVTNVARTAERQEFMDYGKEPLLTVWAELYVPRDSHIDSILKVKDKRIAVMKGDFNAANFKNLVEKFGIHCSLVEFASFADVFQAVATGQVDGGVANNTFGTAKHREYDIKSSGVIFNPFDIYFTVSKGKNRELLETLDRYLTTWKKEEHSPYHLARERWSHGSASTMEVIPSWIKPALLTIVVIMMIAAGFIITLRLQVRHRTAELRAQLDERQKIEETLYQVNETGAARRGDELLAAMSAHLYHALGADYAFVGELLPGDRMRTHGFIAHGLRGEDFEYDLKGTPCENVVGKTRCFYPRGITEQFPGDTLLADIGAESYAATPLWDALGEPIGLMGVVSRTPLENRLFTETILQIVATRAAQELESMYRLRELEIKNYTVEAMRDAVYWMKEDGRFWSVNKGALDMLGYTREELLSLSVPEIDPLFPPEVWAASWETTKREGSARIITQHRKKNGEILPVEISSSYYHFHETEFICAFVRDITDQRKIEEERATLQEQLSHAQRLEAVGRLAGGVAHDFNNKLTVILGYAELLKMSPCEQDPECSNSVREIVRAAEMAREITKRLLIFSRAGEAEKIPMDLNQTLLDFKKTLGRMLGEQVSLRFDLQDNLWHVLLDPTQFDQLLTNLMINARDAIPESGCITITTKNVKMRDSLSVPAGEYVLVCCADTGSGMDQAILEHIFEPFFTTKVAGKGTGLGLASVYGIVKQNNGHITVESTPGKGTVFHIYLPRLIRDNIAEPAADSGTADFTGTGSLLLIEDEAPVRKVTAMMLDAMGYTVTAASSQEHALELCADPKSSFNAVLSDVMMPGMNGFELKNRINALCPDLPFIFMSGYTPESLREQLHDTLNAQIISKPIDYRLLNRALKHAIVPAATEQ